jgi:isopenicillin N synthase-like dioxygenase
MNNTKPLSFNDRIQLEGYQRLGENVTQYKADYHEGLDFYRPVERPDKTAPLQGENQWPDNPAEFRETFERWIDRMLSIGMALMRATAVGLKLDDKQWRELESKVQNSFWYARVLHHRLLISLYLLGFWKHGHSRKRVMRCIGYPRMPADHDGVSCGEHKGQALTLPS